MVSTMKVVKAQTHWGWDNDYVCVIFTKEGWEYLREKMQMDGQQENDNQEGYLIFPGDPLAATPFRIMDSEHEEISFAEYLRGK